MYKQKKNCPNKFLHEYNVVRFNLTMGFQGKDRFWHLQIGFPVGGQFVHLDSGPNKLKQVILRTMMFSIIIIIGQRSNFNPSPLDFLYCNPYLRSQGSTLAIFSTNVFHFLRATLYTFLCADVSVGQPVYAHTSHYVSERHGLKEPAKMEELQMKIIDCLRDHCTYNSEAQKKPQFFSRILGTIPELRTLFSEGLQRLYCLKVQNVCPPPPVIETLFITSQLPF